MYSGAYLEVVDGNLVGIPKKVISRISNYYTTLKENISAETTSIQTQFNTCSPSEYEKLYVKNLLYNTLEQQFIRNNGSDT